MNNESERRRFHRFPFEADCELVLPDDSRHDCELMDLSINGALVCLQQPELFEEARDSDLELRLTGLVRGDRVDMSSLVRAVRVQEDRIACRFSAMDADSFDHLKTLVADNLGDISLLDRELTQLDYWPLVSPEDESP